MPVDLQFFKSITSAADKAVSAYQKGDMDGANAAAKDALLSLTSLASALSAFYPGIKAFDIVLKPVGALGGGYSLGQSIVDFNAAYSAGNTPGLLIALAGGTAAIGSLVATISPEPESKLLGAGVAIGFTLLKRGIEAYENDNGTSAIPTSTEYLTDQTRAQMDSPSISYAPDGISPLNTAIIVKDGNNQNESFWTRDAAGNYYKTTTITIGNASGDIVSINNEQLRFNSDGQPVDGKSYLTYTAVADTFSSRIVTRPIPAAFGAKMLWAELTADAKEYVNPAIAAKATTLTQGTNSWTLPTGAPVVTSAYISGSTPSARMAMDATVTPFGATSQLVTAATQKDGVGGVCAQSTLPSFNATTNSRTVGTRQLTERNVELQQFVSHSGR